jgi:hypothetical protein
MSLLLVPLVGTAAAAAEITEAGQAVGMELGTVQQQQQQHVHIRLVIRHKLSRF